MRERLRFWFDKKGDILDISVGKPRKAVSEEMHDDILIRLNPKTRKVVGFTILNFTKRFGQKKKSKGITTPIEASISLAR
ncbi:MAG: DUF2283 domain-containing protein [Candidatus Micrarchaeales archaeon]